MSRRSDFSCKVYVGDLPRDASEAELDREFSYYGRLRSVWVARNPPGFAFVEFEDPRDAEDSVRALDGRTMCGVRVRVEMSTGRSRGGNRRPPPRRNFNEPDRCHNCNDYSNGKVSRKRSRSRRRSRSRSDSRDRFGRSRNRSDSGSGGGRSYSRSPKRRTHSRSNTPIRNGN